MVRELRIGDEVGIQYDVYVLHAEVVKISRNRKTVTVVYTPPYPDREELIAEQHETLPIDEILPPPEIGWHEQQRLARKHYREEQRREQAHQREARKARRARRAAAQALR